MKTSRIRAVVLTLVLLAPTATVAGESLIGLKIDNFTLADHRGHEQSLDDLKSSPFVVVAFLGTECPLAEMYAPRLVELAGEYGPKGVAFVAIDANSQDSLLELGAFARDQAIEFPLLKDPGNVVADRFAAVRTPEVFVLDGERVVRYHGRVDDQFGVGYKRAAPTRRDLASALDELLDGKEISVAQTEVVGCRIGRVCDPDEDCAVTYSNQIARLLQRRCVACHRPGEIAPFALTDYEEVAGWAPMIDEVVSEGRMPPWHASPEHGKFANEARLSDDEKALIRDWVAAGAPQGDPARLPPPIQFVEGWQMPQLPDQVLYMADEPFEVPADGVVEYKYFQVDPGFTEDKWVRIAECLPDNRRLVHHIVAFLNPPRKEGEPERREPNFFCGFAPGTRPLILPEGMAKKIPAGSTFTFQMHYTPNGTAGTDRSCVGFVFADPATITHEVRTTMAANQRFEIPPGADSYRVEGSRSVPLDVTLISLFPHMHLRGKSFLYEAIYPDGTTETLLDVPRYDFAWQNHFALAEPKPIPKGTRFHVVAHFDNSAENLVNPDPTSSVRWGDQTWEEMMIGYLDVAIPRKDLAPPATDDAAPAAGASGGR